MESFFQPGTGPELSIEMKIINIIPAKSPVLINVETFSFQLPIINIRTMIQANTPASPTILTFPEIEKSKEARFKNQLVGKTSKQE